MEEKRMHEFREKLGEQKWLTDAESLERLSKDYYWYSPILNEKLKDKLAEGIARPESEEELVWILSYAFSHRIAVTARGAGTGNYGQSIPLQGGIVLDLSRLNQILEVGQGYVRVQAGVKMGNLEKKLWESNQELRIYPSTFVKATIGGYISGGSAGIGSTEWGFLWDGNVLEAVIYTMEETPRRVVVQGAELNDFIHNYGTTGILVEVKIPVAPRTLWMQSIAHFPTFEQAARFGEALQKQSIIRKRLITPLEWPVPSFFTPILEHIVPEKACVFLETEDGTLEALRELVNAYGGEIGHVIPASDYRKVVGLSDFTWNHTTLWALKADPKYTYLQAAFSLDTYMEQIKQIKAKYGSDVLMHMEWALAKGNVIPIVVPVVAFTTESKMKELIAYLWDIGLEVNDPHTWVLENDPRVSVEHFLQKKAVHDPRKLLNPGKVTYEI